MRFCIHDRLGGNRERGIEKLRGIGTLLYPHGEHSPHYADLIITARFAKRFFHRSKLLFRFSVYIRHDCREDYEHKKENPSGRRDDLSDEHDYPHDPKNKQNLKPDDHIQVTETLINRWFVLWAAFGRFRLALFFLCSV